MSVSFSYRNCDPVSPRMKPAVDIRIATRCRWLKRWIILTASCRVSGSLVLHPHKKRKTGCRYLTVAAVDNRSVTHTNRKDQEFEIISRLRVKASATVSPLKSPKTNIESGIPTISGNSFKTITG